MAYQELYKSLNYLITEIFLPLQYVQYQSLCIFLNIYFFLLKHLPKYTKWIVYEIYSVFLIRTFPFSYISCAFHLQLVSSCLNCHWCRLLSLVQLLDAFLRINLCKDLIDVIFVKIKITLILTIQFIRKMVFIALPLILTIDSPLKQGNPSLFIAAK